MVLAKGSVQLRASVLAMLNLRGFCSAVLLNVFVIRLPVEDDSPLEHRAVSSRPEVSQSCC
jgi:hypothetical protein